MPVIAGGIFSKGCSTASQQYIISAACALSSSVPKVIIKKSRPAKLNSDVPLEMLVFYV